jgi:hypothetical protein
MSFQPIFSAPQYPHALHVFSAPRCMSFQPVFSALSAYPHTLHVFSATTRCMSFQPCLFSPALHVFSARAACLFSPIAHGTGPKDGPKDMHRNPNARALNSTTNHGPEPASSDRPIPAAGHFRGLRCVSFRPEHATRIAGMDELHRLDGKHVLDFDERLGSVERQFMPLNRADAEGDSRADR